MSIWSTNIDLASINSHCKDTIIDLLGIEFIELGDDYLRARMPVDQRTRQPIGIMHGGASCVLAETMGSIAANLCVDISQHYCVGLDINTNHTRPVRSGFVIGTAKPFHLGKTTQVWGIEILNEHHKLVSITRFTVAVLHQTKIEGVKFP